MAKAKKKAVSMIQGPLARINLSYTFDFKVKPTPDADEYWSYNFNDDLAHLIYQKKHRLSSYLHFASRNDGDHYIVTVQKEALANELAFKLRDLANKHKLVLRNNVKPRQLSKR